MLLALTVQPVPTRPTASKPVLGGELICVRGRKVERLITEELIVIQQESPAPVGDAKDFGGPG